MQGATLNPLRPACRIAEPGPVFQHRPRPEEPVPVVIRDANVEFHSSLRRKV